MYLTLKALSVVPDVLFTDELTWLETFKKLAKTSSF